MTFAPHLRLQPGTLRQAVSRRTRRALASGALRPIETETVFVEHGGVRFMVRVAANLARKDAAREPHVSGGQADPFLPHDPELFVAEVSDTHLCLLNKFNVLGHHLLIVTREFERQEALLTLADFEALWACMGEFDALGFYNGGEVAGASQGHKHLQMVPLPLAEDGPSVPMEPLLFATDFKDAIGVVPGLPFANAYNRLALDQVTDPRAAASVTHKRYRDMLAAVGIASIETPDGPRQSAPYNLLVTRAWMLLVPRSRECIDGIPANALGYAGSLFVRDREQLATIRRRGPLTVLREAAVPASR